MEQSDSALENEEGLPNDENANRDVYLSFKEVEKKYGKISMSSFKRWVKKYKVATIKDVRTQNTRYRDSDIPGMFEKNKRSVKSIVKTSVPIPMVLSEEEEPNKPTHTSQIKVDDEPENVCVGGKISVPDINCNNEPNPRRRTKVIGYIRGTCQNGSEQEMAIQKKIINNARPDTNEYVHDICFPSVFDRPNLIQLVINRLVDEDIAEIVVVDKFYLCTHSVSWIEEQTRRLGVKITEVGSIKYLYNDLDMVTSDRDSDINNMKIVIMSGYRSLINYVSAPRASGKNYVVGGVNRK